MTDVVRIGIIGAGVMGRLHARLIENHPQVAGLTAIADPFNAGFATESGVAHFDDHRTLLASGLVDAVIIANPNKLHVATALDCLSARVPALVEKPVGSDIDSIATLIAAQRSTSVPLLVGHHRRHNAAVAEARRLIDAGSLGSIRAITGMYFVRKDDAYFGVEWHRRSGAGVLMINAVHDIDLFRYFCGEIIEVSCVTSNGARGNEVEDTAAMTMMFESGAVGTLTVSDATPSPWGWDQGARDDQTFPFTSHAFSYALAGTTASIELPVLRIHRYEDDSGDWHYPMHVQEPRIEARTAFSQQLLHFADVVRGKAEPLVTVDDASRSLAVVLAALESASTGVPVPIREREVAD